MNFMDMSKFPLFLQAVHKFTGGCQL